MNERHKRQSFLGPESSQIFQSCTAAIVGLGGGGSHIAQQLAHLGLGNVVPIDPDIVEESNLNRLVGATALDVIEGMHKTIVAERVIKSINPDARVDGHTQKWQQCHEALRSCDVIFGCVDSYQDRQELEITARRYLIPYIDIGMDVYRVGTEFSVSGQVILSMPDALCTRCLGFLRDDVLAEEAKNYGAAGHRPQVVWANGVLASAAVEIFTQLVTPWHRSHSETVYLEYDGNTHTLTKSPRLICMEGKACPHFSSTHDLGDPFWFPEEFRGLELDPSELSGRENGYR